MMKSLILAFLLFPKPSFGEDLPEPRIEPVHEKLFGEWVYLKGFCSNWTQDERETYHTSLRDNWFAEHLFINSWDLKFLQNQLIGEKSNRPYEFCHRTIYFEPRSKGEYIFLSKQEIETFGDCQVDSVLEEANTSIALRYRMDTDDRMVAFFREWPGCDGSSLSVFYKRKGS